MDSLSNVTSRGQLMSKNAHQTTAQSVNKIDSEKVEQQKTKVCPTKRQIKLKNVADQELVFTDRIHGKNVKSIGCGTKCKGSLMGTLTKQSPKSKDEILAEAEDFCQQYFSSLKRKDSTEHRLRWNDVKKSISETGTYHLTTEELTFGAKTGWRNAPRCIGRIQWTNLHLIDAREVTDARGMFEVICQHMKYATNDGKLRSAITVFRQRIEGKHDFRIWNTQLISYAGYRQQDGSIIGDPINADFTELCMKMGWKGKHGMFDILPLVLQAYGGQPEMFEYPKDLVLEAEIVHPSYPKIKDLGIRWYCLPAVSNMMLDCGGLQFTACPFSGWYMVTEIATRDLCDKHRYNMLEKIADAIDLDTRSPTSLWRDKAVIEINIAVLHSFQAVGATIVDHHSVSESFMTFMRNEHKARGGCPADWVWIVPPISGSLTPVFHQEMLLYKLKPSYEYQDEVWRTYAWQEPTKLEEKSKRHLSFKIISRVLYHWLRLMKHSMSKRIKCTILYATETGKSELFAHTLHKVFRQNFNARVLSMDQYSVSELRKEELVLFVTSTFGDGNPPETGKKFAHAITTIKSSPERLNGKNGSSRCTNSNGGWSTGSFTPLGHIKFSVFGLGSRAYPKFCAFSHLIDSTIESLGGIRIYSLGEGDELCGQEESFRHWTKKVFQVACSFFSVKEKCGLSNASELLDRVDTSWSQGKFRIVPGTCTDIPLHEELSKVYRRQVCPCKLKDRKRLTQKGASRHTVLSKIDIRQYTDTMHYSPGDHLLVYPQNPPKLVQDLIDVLKDAPPEQQPVSIEKRLNVHEKDTGNGFWKKYNRVPTGTLHQIISKYLDITTPPTQEFLNVLSNLVEKSEDKFKMKRLINNSRSYNEWKTQGMPTITDVIKMFPSLKVTPDFILTQLPLLQPRYYSVSSSLAACPGEVHVTFEVLEYQTPDGSKHKGVCSNWLNELSKGETVMCSVRMAPLYQMPRHQEVPILMVGSGTGIAPFRSFWLQRKHDTMYLSKSNGSQQQCFGEMILFYGCRNATCENIFKDELGQLQKDQVLTKCYLAYSREPGIKKTYVQDLINKNGRDVYKKLIRENGHLYICGNVQMASDVKTTLMSVIMSFSRKSQKQAEEYLNKMKDENRLHEDIFGVSIKKKGRRCKPYISEGIS